MQARQAPAAHTQARFAERMCGGSGATMRGCSSLRAFASCSRYRQLRDGLLWPASCMAQPCSPLWGRGKVCMARPCRHLRVLHKRTSCGSHQVSACISPLSPARALQACVQAPGHLVGCVRSGSRRCKLHVICPLTVPGCHQVHCFVDLVSGTCTVC